MKYIEKAIKEAQKINPSLFNSQSNLFLDPAFWQALGKALGWQAQTIGSFKGAKRKRVVDEKECQCCNKIKEFCRCWNFEIYERWHGEMMKFTNHLASGKDAESFFKELLAP